MSYRPMDCGNCGRRRVLTDGVCEKCRWDNDGGDYASVTRPGDEAGGVDPAANDPLGGADLALPDGKNEPSGALAFKPWTDPETGRRFYMLLDRGIMQALPTDWERFTVEVDGEEVVGYRKPASPDGNVFEGNTFVNSRPAVPSLDGSGCRSCGSSKFAVELPRRDGLGERLCPACTLMFLVEAVRAASGAGE